MAFLGIIVPLLGITGLILFIVNWFRLLFLAFQVGGILWGLASFFLHFPVYVFVALHWEESRRIFSLYMIGGMLSLILQSGPIVRYFNQEDSPSYTYSSLSREDCDSFHGRFVNGECLDTHITERGCKNWGGQFVDGNCTKETAITEDQCHALKGRLIDGHCFAQSTEAECIAQFGAGSHLTDTGGCSVPASEPQNTASNNTATEIATPSDNRIASEKKQEEINSTIPNQTQASNKNEPNSYTLEEIKRERAQKGMSEKEKEIAFKKSFTASGECQDSNLSWKEIVECSDEKANARAAFFRTH